MLFLFFADLGRQDGGKSKSERKTRDTVTWSLHSSLRAIITIISLLLFHLCMKRIVPLQNSDTKFIRAFHPLRRYFCDQSTSRNADHLVCPSITAQTAASSFDRLGHDNSQLLFRESQPIGSIADTGTSLDKVRSSSSLSFNSDLAPKLEPPHIIARHTFPPIASHSPRICMRLSVSEHHVLPTCPL